MPHLEIRLLGPFEVALDGEPASGFDSDKVRALCAYLVTEADRSHRRQSLAGLLWPEWTEREARGNLRSALANLRRVIRDDDADPPHLKITRQSLQFNVEGKACVDVHEFAAATRDVPLNADDVAQVERSLRLYRGEFLEGFAVADSAAFEEWMLRQRNHLHRELLNAHQRLATHYEQLAEYDRALRHATRQLEIEPWLEEAHRQAMRALALSGQRGAALAQYATAKRALAQELGVEPAPETVELHQSIQEGEFGPGTTPMRPKAIRGYELREQIGEGSFGIVYRGHQPTIGRGVASKVIRPEFASRPEFIRRFEAEAQVIARLEHPHIVPLYDYWRDPEGAHLVTRWFRAGSLADALKLGPWKPEAAARLLEQIAGALSVAHRQHVVHRDLKPANILLDDDRNAYLSDFGIAMDPIGSAGNEDGSGLTGTPGYSSPEQIRDQPVTPAADLYALGVILFELFVADHPFPTDSVDQLLMQHLNDPLPSVVERRPELPSALDEVIQRATSKNPDQRYSSTEELSDALRSATRLAVAVTDPPSKAALVQRNPYKGLRPFLEPDAADFFGRDSLVEQLVVRLGEEGAGARFLAVVGPSGSGKSSAVRAGLIPKLREGAIPGSSNWFYVTMFPGNHPYQELEAALLRIAVNPPPSLLDQLQSNKDGILRAVKRVLPDEEAELVLVIDQFEEFFTLAENESERTDFIESLMEAIKDPRGRLRVIVTLRADFYDRPLQYPELGELFKRRAEVVLPLSASELERTIAGPGESVGLEVESELVANLIGDVTEQPGALPLLQYALTELFERRENGRLTLAAYQGIGALGGAIGRRAEELYAGLGAEGQDAARQLFLQLVALGEGVEDTRRRVIRTELRGLGPDPDALERVIDTFGAARLLSFDRDPSTRSPTVEVAHEALLREWPRLRAWIDTSREDLRLSRRLSRAASEWEEADGDAGYLLRGSRLVQFQIWAAETDLSLADRERNYLEQSVAHEAQRQHRAARRRRAVVGALAAAAAVASGLAAFAFNRSEEARRQAEFAEQQSALAQQQSVRAEEQAALAESERDRAEEHAGLAEQQARLATARELAGASVQSLADDPELSLLLALEAAESTRSAGEPVLAEAIEALHLALGASRALLTLPGTPADISPDGRLVITGAYPWGSQVTWNPVIRDASTGEPILELPGGPAEVAFSPSGRTVAVAYTSVDGLSIFDAATGDEIMSLPAERGFEPQFSPDERYLAVTEVNNAYSSVWDLESGEEIYRFSYTGYTMPPDFSPDGSLIAVPEPLASKVHIHDLESGALLRSLDHPGELRWTGFDPTGRYLHTFVTQPVGEVRIWDVSTWQEILEIPTGIAKLEWSPDGRSLAAASNEAIKIYDVETGDEVMRLLGHAHPVNHLKYSQDGTKLLSATNGGISRVWDVSPAGRGEVAAYETPDEIINTLEFGGGGNYLLSAALNGYVRMFDARTGEQLAELSDQVVNWPMTVIVSPDGSLISTLGNNFVTTVRDIETWEVISSFPPKLFPLAFSPDNSRIIVAPFGGAASDSAAFDSRFCCPKLVDIASGAVVLEMEEHTDTINDAAFSPDGNYFATGGADWVVRLYESASLEHISTMEFEHNLLQVDFSPDSAYLAAGDIAGLIRIWDVAALQAGANPEQALVHEFVALSDPVIQMRFSRDGRMLAISGFDFTAAFWDVESGQRLYRIRFGKLNENVLDIADFALSPDGRTVAAIGGGTLRYYALDIEELIALAETRVTRSLTDEECRQYLHVEKCSAAD